MRRAAQCYLGLGGNLGHPLTLFDAVVAYFETHPMASEVKESPRYKSAPVDATGPDYVNSVMTLRWAGSPEALLEACLSLETQFGRVRSTRNAPRPIDVDVLMFDQDILNTTTLTLPHPRMHLRRFVLQPLLDLNPEVSIPGQGKAKLLLQGTLDQTMEPI